MAVEHHIVERTDLPNHCCPTSEPIAQIEYIFLLNV